MVPFCPRCHYPCHEANDTCLACGRPVPGSRNLPKRSRTKPTRKARRKKRIPITRDNDPTAS